MGLLSSVPQDLLVEIDDSADDFMKNSKELSAMEKTKRIGEISKQFTKCKEYGDDKVSLAMQARSMLSFIHIVPQDITTVTFIIFFFYRLMNWWISTSGRYKDCNRVLESVVCMVVLMKSSVSQSDFASLSSWMLIWQDSKPI